MKPSMMFMWCWVTTKNSLFDEYEPCTSEQLRLIFFFRPSNPFVSTWRSQSWQVQWCPSLGWWVINTSHTELFRTSRCICISTLNVRGPSCLGLTRSISWLLMLLFLASPGHQHPWYGPCRIGRSLPYLRKYFNYLCHVNVEEWHKM